MGKIEILEKNKAKLIEELQIFMTNDLDVEIGALGCEELFDFIMEKLSPAIYNKAINDAQSWYGQKFNELNLDSDMLLKEERI